MINMAKEYKLDLLDKKILYELDKDARMPISILAKKVRRDRAVVNYRINQLVGSGIIQNFVTLLDPGRVGVMIWNIYLQLQDTNKEIEKEIVDYMTKNKRIWWVGKCTGKWDIICSFLVKDIKEFYDLVIDFQSKFGRYIQNQNLVAHAEVEIISRGYLLGKAGEGVTWFKENKPEKIDEIDKKIIKELSINARIPCTELASKLKLTPRVINYRIKDLIKRKIITKFRLQLDVKRIGYSFYKAIIYLKDYTPQKDEKLKNYCLSLGNVFHYEKKIGPWMLELEMDVESYEKFNEILRNMKEKFPDFIKDFDGMLIYEEPKGQLDISKVL